MTRPLTVLAVLAAGSGSRFTGPTHKLHSPLGGSTVSGLAVRSALEADLGPVVVVVGATELALPSRVTQLLNPRWQQGLATSVQVAITHARALGADTLVIGLGDQPLVVPSAWQAVAHSPSPIAVATYAGVRANPVKLAASVWDEMPHEGDEGARAVMRRHPEWVTEVPCDGSAADVDTAQDLDEIRRSTKGRND
jgi:CTP:molybdopterin cytidylyltransferase MocA